MPPGNERSAGEEPENIVVLLYDRGSLKRVHGCQIVEPCAGIWWHHANRVVAILQKVVTVDTDGPLIDSNLSHDSAWEAARSELGAPAEAEYFDVPRGRVVWDATLQIGFLYHGNGTPPHLRDALASLFGLPRSNSRLDEHYLIGEALEAFLQQAD